MIAILFLLLCATGASEVVGNPSTHEVPRISILPALPPPVQPFVKETNSPLVYGVERLAPSVGDEAPVFSRERIQDNEKKATIEPRESATAYWDIKLDYTPTAEEAEYVRQMQGRMMKVDRNPDYTEEEKYQKGVRMLQAWQLKFNPEGSSKKQAEGKFPFHLKNQKGNNLTKESTSDDYQIRSAPEEAPMFSRESIQELQRKAFLNRGELPIQSTQQNDQPNTQEIAPQEFPVSVNWLAEPTNEEELKASIHSVIESNVSNDEKEMTIKQLEQIFKLSYPHYYKSVQSVSGGDWVPQFKHFLQSNQPTESIKSDQSNQPTESIKSDQSNQPTESIKSDQSNQSNQSTEPSRSSEQSIPIEGLQNQLQNQQDEVQESAIYCFITWMDWLTNQYRKTDQKRCLHWYDFLSTYPK